jgi:hypothetical protein
MRILPLPDECDKCKETKPVVELEGIKTSNLWYLCEQCIIKLFDK